MTDDANAPMMTVRQAALQVLRDLGVDRVFGNPGSTELPFLDRWPNDIAYVLGLQEATVLAMADGYAQASGRLAFVNLHSAAGVGHALGNLHTAFRNQTPMVVTAGQQVRDLLLRHPFLFAERATEFPRPYVKWAIEPARAEDVPAALAQAAHVALQKPCGPTFVSIPIDDWGRPARLVPPRRVGRDTAPDPALIAEVAAALQASRRPALVAGPQIDQDGAWDAMVALAERTRAAVWVSPFSHRASFPEDHPLFAGFLPAEPAAVAARLAPYDAILVLGAPVFTFHVAGVCDILGGGVPIFHITDNPEEAARSGAGASLVGSMRLALPALRALLGETDRAAPEPRRPAPAPAPSQPIRAEYLMHALSQTMPDDAVLVEEAPSHRPAMQAHLPIRRPASFHTMASGGLGYSLPASVGMALAQPQRPVVCLIGDGSLMYSVQALWTAVQQRCNLVVVVVNNGGYGAMRAFSQVLGVQGAPGIELPGLDFVTLAAGFGCPGQKIERAELLLPALREAFATGGPMLLDVAVDAAIPHLYGRPG
jgi:benzoylformate decarboxylase